MELLKVLELGNADFSQVLESPGEFLKVPERSRTGTAEFLKVANFAKHGMVLKA